MINLGDKQMLDICYEELEELKQDIEDDNFRGIQYLDTWDNENDYSHDHIEENRKKFIELANEYFSEQDLPYIMREVYCSAMVCDRNSGEILYQPK